MMKKKNFCGEKKRTGSTSSMARGRLTCHVGFRIETRVRNYGADMSPQFSFKKQQQPQGPLRGGSGQSATFLFFNLYIQPRFSFANYQKQRSYYYPQPIFKKNKRRFGVTAFRNNQPTVFPAITFCKFLYNIYLFSIGALPPPLVNRL